MRKHSAAQHSLVEIQMMHHFVGAESIHIDWVHHTTTKDRFSDKWSQIKDKWSWIQIDALLLWRKQLETKQLNQWFSGSVGFIYLLNKISTWFWSKQFVIKLSLFDNSQCSTTYQIHVPPSKQTWFGVLWNLVKKLRLELLIKTICI